MAGVRNVFRPQLALPADDMAPLLRGQLGGNGLEGVDLVEWSEATDGQRLARLGPAD